MPASPQNYDLIDAIHQYKELTRLEEQAIINIWVIHRRTEKSLPDIANHLVARIENIQAQTELPPDTNPSDDPVLIV